MPQNGTQFGDEISKEVIKLKLGYWDGPLSNVIDVFKRGENLDKEAQKGNHVTVQGEDGHL